MSKQNRIITILFVLIFLNVCFIFGQSLLDGPTSNMLSSRFEILLEGFFGKLFNLGVDLYRFTRKLAHFIEFCVLSVLVTSNCHVIKKAYNKSFFGYGAFAVLFIAVLDEYIQSFSNRTSSVTDVLIDCIGAAVGFAAVRLLVLIKSKRKNTNKKQFGESN